MMKSENTNFSVINKTAIIIQINVNMILFWKNELTQLSPTYASDSLIS